MSLVGQSRVGPQSFTTTHNRYSQSRGLIPAHLVMNKLFVISVRHSGTRFLSKTLNCHHDHVDRIKELKDGFIYASPLRDPRKVWLSWAVRDTRTSLVCRGPATGQDCFIDSWNRLAELENVLYVPIDRPERDAQIRVLERKINNGLPLFRPVRSINVDWTKRTGHVSYPSELPYDDWYDEFDFIYDLPMIKPYYKR